MQALPVVHGDKARLALVVHLLSVLLRIIRTMANWQTSIPRLIVLHKHIPLLVRVKETQVGGMSWFVGMGESLFIPENGCAPAEENRLANKQSRPPKPFPVHTLCWPDISLYGVLPQ